MGQVIPLQLCISDEEVSLKTKDMSVGWFKGVDLQSMLSSKRPHIFKVANSSPSGPHSLLMRAENPTNSWEDAMVQKMYKDTRARQNTAESRQLFHDPLHAYFTWECVGNLSSYAPALHDCCLSLDKSQWHLMRQMNLSIYQYLNKMEVTTPTQTVGIATWTHSSFLASSFPSTSLPPDSQSQKCLDA